MCRTEIERCTAELLERLQVANDATIVTEYKAHQQSLDNNKSFAKIASSSGRIKRRYSVNTLRTHSDTASVSYGKHGIEHFADVLRSPRGSPRLSASVDAADEPHHPYAPFILFSQLECFHCISISSYLNRIHTEPSLAPLQRLQC